MTMDGSLYKWAGYFAGWNKNYCTLKDGVLSVFESQNEISDQPAIDSLNIGLCEIIIHDDYQWELKGANSKTWFLKAHTTEEKHKWIKALGSSKACLLGTPLLSHLPSFDAQSVTSYGSETTFDKISRLSSTSSHEIEASKDIPSESDDLIRECEIVLSSIGHLRDSLINVCTDEERKSSLESAEISLRGLLERLKVANETSELSDRVSDQLTASSQQSSSTSTDESSETSITEEASSDATDPVLVTFFTTCQTRFSDVQSEMKQDLIPVDIFLEACTCFTFLLDRLAGSLLSPLRTDILSNAEKIRKARDKITPKVLYLQEIVQAEIKAKNFTGADTGTQAILWLHRSLMVMSVFFFNVFLEESSTYMVSATSFQRAYEDYLEVHHNWMTQKLFKMGLKMLPDCQSFIRNMVEENCLVELQQNEPAREELLQKVLKLQSLTYAEELRSVATVLRNLFISLHIKP